jgi:hypothetical protein
MRKDIFIIGFWCLCYVISYGQTSTNIDVIGTWRVVGGEVNFPPAPNNKKKKQVEAAKQQFLHSVFVFKEDHNFNFNIAISDLKIQKGHWKYNEKLDQYEIQKWEDKDKDNSFLMIVEVQKEGDETYFVLPTDGDTPKEVFIKLHVVRIL